MGCIQFTDKLVSRPKFEPLNSFETKAVGFCKRPADVVVVQFFITFFTAIKSNDRQTFDWMNSIKFRVSLLAKHWTYQTLNECITAAVVICPIEKYKLKVVWYPQYGPKSLFKYGEERSIVCYCTQEEKLNF